MPASTSWPKNPAPKRASPKPKRPEQAALRREYIDEMKQSLRSQLDNADYIDDKGVRRPVSDLKKVKN